MTNPPETTPAETVAATMRASLRALKDAMTAAVRAPVAQFERETGLSPRRIDVEFELVSLAGDGVGEGVVRRVDVTLHGVELD